MKEYLKSIFEMPKDRLKNPFVVAFLMAWVVSNWRVALYLVFDDSNMGVKISYIEKNFLESTDLWMPIAIALSYIVVLPYIMYGLEWITSSSVKNRRGLKTDQRLIELKGQERVLRQERINENIKSGNIELSKLNESNSKLKNELRATLSQLSNVENKTKSQIEELTKQFNKEVEDNAKLLGDINTLNNKIKEYQDQNVFLKEDLESQKLFDVDRIYFLGEIYGSLKNLLAHILEHNDFPRHYGDSEGYEFILKQGLIIKKDKEFLLTERGIEFLKLSKTKRTI